MLPSTCAFPGCNYNGKLIRGLCMAHYMRVRRSENPKLRSTQRASYSTTKNGAKIRNLDFSLTPGEFRNLISQNCAYGAGKYPEINIGIDRRDNRIGYTAANAQPCCARHNEIKSNVFTHEEMLQIVKTCPSAAACGNARGGRKMLAVPIAPFGPRKRGRGPRKQQG